MAWWNPISWFTGDDDEEKEDPYKGLLTAISPILQQQKEIAADLAGQGKGDLGAARDQYKDLISYFQNILHGSRDEVLKNEDVSGITASYDQAERMLGQFGVRGGRSAEKLSSLPFEKAGEINRLVQALRKNAPDQLFQLAQAMAQLGTNEYNISAGSGNAFVGNQFGIQDRRDARYENEQARETAIITAILGTAGRVAGAGIGAM